MQEKKAPGLAACHNSYDPFQSPLEHEMCQTAAETSGNQFFLTDPKVPECKDAPVFPPSNQTQEDTREFCGMHEV